MAYQWVEDAPQYSPGTISQFAIGNGVVTMDCSLNNAGEGGTDPQFIAFLGAFKDALETAGFTLGAIRTTGGVTKTLTVI